MQESHHHRPDVAAAAQAVDTQNLKNGHARSAAEERKER
jgi:hypothetical protein